MSFFDDLDAKLAREKPVKPIKLRPAEEGDECANPNCRGLYESRGSEDGCCSCHIAPPCGWCTDQFLACTECGAEPNGRGRA
jgi:hypothetical protein